MQMATTLSSSSTSISPRLNFPSTLKIRSNRLPNFRCKAAEDSTNNSATKNNKGSESENVVLKVAWYSSELLGIAASFFRSPANVVESPDGVVELAGDGDGAIDRARVVETIKEDFQRSYFVTGCLLALLISPFEIILFHGI